MATLETVIDTVVSPWFHNNDPVKFDAVNTELPQLLTTVTVGADGTVLGADVTFAAGLIHPFVDVCVAVYVAALVTVIEADVAPLLHNNEPV